MVQFIVKNILKESAFWYVLPEKKINMETF